MGQIKQISNSLWTVPHDLTLAGVLALNTRMTVCKLQDGGLLLISPVPCSEALRSAIDALGPIRTLISPNLYHHLYLGEWIAAYPDARSFGPPGLRKKRPDLQLTDELGPSFDAAFKEEIERFSIEGMPTVNESLFHHHASDTLITTDFCFFMPEAKGLTSLYASLMGFKNRVRCPFIFRAAIKDQEAFRTSLRPLRAINPQHLAMCHHAVLSKAASEALNEVLDRRKVEA